jgi:hypothetical protein
LRRPSAQNSALTPRPNPRPPRRQRRQCREKKGRVCEVTNIPITVSAHKCSILAAGRAVEAGGDDAEARNLCTSNSNAQAGYADAGPTAEGGGKTSTTFDIVDAAGKDRYRGSRWTFQVRGRWSVERIGARRGPGRARGASRALEPAPEPPQNPRARRPPPRRRARAAP